MNLDQETKIALDIIRIIDCDLWEEVIANPEEFSYQVDQITDLIDEAYNSGLDDGYKMARADYGFEGP